MEKIPDEILMAYADDALPPLDRRRIDALLAKDAGLALRLQPFVVTRAALPEIFAAALQGPMPDRLVKTVLNAPVKQAAARQSAFGGIGQSIRNLLLPQTPSFASALALCCTVLAVGGAGWYAANMSFTTPSGSNDFMAHSGNDTIARGTLLVALETAPMRQPVAAPDGRTATPVVTFRNTEGRYCRQFEITMSATEGLAGYACRRDTGQWQIGFQGTFAPSAPPLAGADNSPADRPALPELESAIDSFIIGNVLGSASENELIAKGWRQ